MAKEILEELGYLPLAIAQAGAYIAVRRFSNPMETYLSIYRTNARNLLAHMPAPATWNYRNDTVFTTWELSFAAIKEEMPTAADLLLLCGFLSKEDIWEDLLRDGLGLPENGDSLP
jgi:hypothetical protein